MKFRCTRNLPYTAPSCPGRVDLSARVGYHMDVPDHTAALESMALRFPDDVWEYQNYKEHAFTVTEQ